MQKGINQVRRVLCGILFIGVSVQIVLGLIWMAANIAGFQEFGESSLYVEISKSFLCDEYMGILYPVLLVFARGLEDLLGLPYYIVMYLVQLTVGCYACHRFVWACMGRKRRSLRHLWGTFGLMTIPAVMQCYLAVLPHGLTFSFFLLMMSYVMEAVGEPDKLQCRTLIKMLPLWLVCALLMPEYQWIGLVPILCLFVYSSHALWKKNRRQIGFHALMIVAFCGIIASLFSVTQVSGSMGRMQKSLAGAAVSRFVWPNFLVDYEHWPLDIKEVLTVDLAWETSRNAEGVFTALGPAMEQAVGQEQAKAYYWKLISIELPMRTKENLKNIVWDMISYTAAPWALGQQLQGVGYESYSGRNYEIMKMRTPGLTKQYVQYGNWWFGVGVVLALCCKLMKKAKLKTAYFLPANVWGCRIILILTGLTMAAGYTMSGAGMMDYKNTLFLTTLWYVWMVYEAKGWDA